MAMSVNKIQNNGNIISVPDRQLPYRKCLGELLFEKMAENTHLIAQTDGITAEKDTYDNFLKRCIRTAVAMRSKGITRGDIVTVCSFNHLNTFVPIVASLFLGVKVASTDPVLSLSDTAFLLQQVQPKLVFASTDATKLIEDAVREAETSSEIVVFGDSEIHTKFSEFLDESFEEEGFLPVDVADLKETAAIFFSSGTTGLPKAVCLSHLALLAQIWPKNPTKPLPVTNLLFSTPYWISSLMMLINDVVAGDNLLIVPNFDAKTFWGLIEEHRVFMVFLSPSQIAAVCQYATPDTDRSSLKILATAGAPLLEEQDAIVRNLLPGTLFLKGYGQTELGGGVLGFGASPEHLRLSFRKPMSCGLPLSGISYKIVDLETEEVLGPNQQGELRIKTEYQMNGYLNTDSSDAWDSDGFLKTGDIAYYDEDYCFYIVDRIKDMLKFQSWQIAPAMLEGILLTHPAVESAVVVGLPHPFDGDHPLGIVVLNEKAGDVDERDIEKYVDNKVSDKHRLRGGVKIVKSIPVTPSGKFKRKYIRDLAIEGKI